MNESVLKEYNRIVSLRQFADNDENILFEPHKKKFRLFAETLSNLWDFDGFGWLDLPVQAKFSKYKNLYKDLSDIDYLQDRDLKFTIEEDNYIVSVLEKI